MVGIATISGEFQESFSVFQRAMSPVLLYRTGRPTAAATLATLGVTPGTYVWTWGTESEPELHASNPPAIPPATNLTNVSTRASVQTGAGVTIAGFIVTGTDSKHSSDPGLGPTLTESGVTGVLADPTLQLFDGSGHPIVV